jgi:hypothetical protein
MNDLSVAEEFAYALRLARRLQNHGATVVNVPFHAYQPIHELPM